MQEKIDTAAIMIKSKVHSVFVVMDCTVYIIYSVDTESINIVLSPYQPFF